jgi:hypothetical protein
MSPNYIAFIITCEEKDKLINDETRCWSVIFAGSALGAIWWDAVTGELIEHAYASNPIHYKKP